MIRDELIARRDYLLRVINYIENTTDEPKGKLRCKTKDGHTEYYISNNDTNDKYKYLSDINIAKDIAQHDYNKDVLRASKDEIKHINNFLKHQKDNLLERIYDKLSPGRKALVKPFALSDEEYTRKWLSVKYQGNTSWPIDKPQKTRKGEIVRSKSEMTIANLLYSLGIPYRYEYPVKFKDGTIFYSDFTALNVRERKEYRIEHLGLINNAEYFENAMDKIEMYNENGYFIGKNLIITRDKKGGILDSRWLEQNLRAYLL